MWHRMILTICLVFVLTGLAFTGDMPHVPGQGLRYATRRRKQKPHRNLVRRDDYVGGGQER